MSELNVEIDLAKCLTQHGFVLHMNEIFQFGRLLECRQRRRQRHAGPGLDCGAAHRHHADQPEQGEKKPNDGPNHGLKWAMDRFDMYQRYWDRPGRKKSFHVACRG